MKDRIEVVGALIKNDKGQFLICQRPKDKKRGLLWEFVGGKLEKDETKEKALIRECFEELDINIKPGKIFLEVKHDYPDININLTIFNCIIDSGEIRLKEHNDYKWISASEIENYEFCPADKDILERIKEEEN